jgi:trehalose synthase
MTEVPIAERPLHRFLPIVGQDHLDGTTRLAEMLRARLAGRTVWNVNSTAAGGGVAEMLPSLLAYARGTGCDARWVVIEGDPGFFQVTKRLHHALHGSPGDGSALSDEARRTYEATALRNAPALLAAVRARDVVILHDPQTAGLAPCLLDAGALVIWRSHIGHDVQHPEVAAGWAFLEPYLRRVPAFVFTRQTYVPDACDHGKTTIITPSIDAFSAKNQDLGEAAMRAILTQAGLVAGGVAGAPEFIREDGGVGRVVRGAEVVRVDGPPAWDVPLVVQVSRWDPLKDPVGVLRGFVDLVRGGGAAHAELVLAGPDVRAVTDDPEGALVFHEVVDVWRGLPDAVRARVHLASLPMADVEENAAIVNALQRHATIVVQKSLQEGFGLTVTEAMWKQRPIVASAVGGIQDQIEHGVHGLLLDDPADRAALASALRHLLADPAYASRLGENARARVRERFLGLDHLAKYAYLIDRLDEPHQARRTAGRRRG